MNRQKAYDLLISRIQILNDTKLNTYDVTNSRWSNTLNAIITGRNN